MSLGIGAARKLSSETIATLWRARNFSSPATLPSITNSIDERPSLAIASSRRSVSPRCAGRKKLAARVHYGKADAPLEVHLLERQADRLAEPVLDHGADHVEEMHEVDDAGGIAMRKADQPLAGERH